MILVKRRIRRCVCTISRGWGGAGGHAILDEKWGNEMFCLV